MHIDHCQQPNSIHQLNSHMSDKFIVGSKELLAGRGNHTHWSRCLNKVCTVVEMSLLYSLNPYPIYHSIVMYMWVQL